MRFNWENNRLIIGTWPMMSGGEFIIRCLGMSRHIIPIADSEDIYTMIGLNWDEHTNTDLYQQKFNIIRSYEPDLSLSQGGYWHGKFLNSTNWLDTDDRFLTETRGRGNNDLSSWFSTSLWIDAEFASRHYFDRFWREPSCAVSKSNFGLVIKTHRPEEVSGLKHLIPQAKIFSLVNYSQWQQWCLDNKIHDTDKQLWQSPDYSPIDSSFCFDVDRLLSSDDSFLLQMKESYSYFDLDDFDHVEEHLIDLKHSYLQWNIRFSN